MKTRIPNTKKDIDQVKEYMIKLVHPLKAEIEAVRTIIKMQTAKFQNE